MPLGTILKNDSECDAGAMIHKDVVQNNEQRSRKKYSKDETSFPDESNILVHAAEVLRQVEGTRLEKMAGSVEILGSEVHHAT